LARGRPRSCLRPQQRRRVTHVATARRTSRSRGTAANSAAVPARTASSGGLTAQSFAELFDDMVQNIGLVIKGKEDVVRLSLVALLAGGHVLFEDMPGTGKTILARAIAQTIN